MAASVVTGGSPASVGGTPLMISRMAFAIVRPLRAFLLQPFFVFGVGRARTFSQKKPRDALVHSLPGSGWHTLICAAPAARDTISTAAR